MESKYLTVGQELERWCSKCGQQTTHIWNPEAKAPMECQKCKDEVAKK